MKWHNSLIGIQVPEDRIALILGHERGSTESFKTYSKHAASPVELSKYIELIDYEGLGVCTGRAPSSKKGIRFNVIVLF